MDRKPHLYEWIKLVENKDEEESASARAGHTLTATNAGFIMYGGMDGRRDQHTHAPAPNSDLFILRILKEYKYEWSSMPLDATSQNPPAPRTLHSAIATSPDDLFIFGGIHSAMPFQCLQDGWMLDTSMSGPENKSTNPEWKKVHFKAQATGKGSQHRRKTGLIQDRRHDDGSRRRSSSGRRSSAARSSFRGNMASGRVSFESLAGAASRAVHEKRSSTRASVSGGLSKKQWKDSLQKKMGAMLQSKPGSMKMRKPTGGTPSSHIMTTNEEQFHEELIAMVCQTGMEDTTESSGIQVPPPRSNLTLVLVENMVVLFGGHGGVGYQRKAFNDSWILNLDSYRWNELNCQGSIPAPRSGHCAFAKDTDMFVFAGWNNETQFNDLFQLDIENKDWSDVDLAWGSPRWNCALQLVEAIPSWRVFVFGGTADSNGEGRGGGTFDNRVGVLNLAEEKTWSEPALEGDTKCVCPPREHSAICYEKGESRLIVFGGWSNKWLDDVWQINVSSIVGPPYAILQVQPNLGPVSGNMKVIVHGEGFKGEGLGGMCYVQFATKKLVAPPVQGTIISDEVIECLTPNVITPVNIGPAECEVRILIGQKDWTTTVSNYTFFHDTKANTSLCFGPGVQAEQQAGRETRFIIQARNEFCENRQSGRDEFIVRIQQKSGGDPDGKNKVYTELPFDLTDLNTGQYEVKYVADEGEVVVEVSFLDKSNIQKDPQKKKVRGSPFNPTFSNMARNKANEYAGPLINAWVTGTLKYLEEFFNTTNNGHSSKLKENDVDGLIGVMNHIWNMEREEEELIRKQDELFEMMTHLEKKEGIGQDKQQKQLKKIGVNLTQLKADIEAKKKEIEPTRQKESEKHRNVIKEFEDALKVYQSNMKNLPQYEFRSGLELALQSMDDVHKQLGEYDATLALYQMRADNFEYPKELNNSRKVIQQMRDELKNMKELWDYEIERIGLTEKWLVQKWGNMFPQKEDLEDEIKACEKKLKEIGGRSADLKKCGTFIALKDIMKKWCDFTPLVGELLDPAMRARHWKQLMKLAGRSIDVTPDILLRDMWNLELHKCKDAVEETSIQAKEEAKMEAALKKIGKEWAEVEFVFHQHKDSEYSVMTISDEKFELLEEHQVNVQNMFASRFLATFETEVETWRTTLSAISEVSTLLAEVQRSWAFLENLFIYSEEVKNELQAASDKFLGIDMEVKEILKNGFEIRLAKDFCNQSNIMPKLERSMKELNVCEKALNDFMDGKRRLFPRFYFMSSADLLDVLSNGNSPGKVVAQFPKFFIAIDNYTLEWPDGEKGRPIATGMNACVGKEYVPFAEPLHLLGKVEVYLDQCIETFRHSLKHFTKVAMKEYNAEDENGMTCKQDGFRRGEFIGVCQAAQCALLVQLIEWVKLVELGFVELEGGNENAVSEKWKEQAALLLKLIEKTMTNLDKPTRQKIMCAITLDAHNRDVQEKLVLEKVTSRDEFQWQSMLKCYWIEEEDDAQMQICDAKFWYGYEYLGNGPRLVVTPLTDRIYVTATQALHLHMGCAPAGPAGTGKTESTKDLANAVAKACYVINAAPEMDYLTLGNIYKGLSASGSWGCFDEFNRLVPEVLSVCTVQFRAVCDAIKAKLKKFILQDDEMTLDPAVGCFITMNPGYLGRSELPEGLKALFRPITVMVPDFKLIMENMFMGEGFTEAKALGLKFSTLYALNKDLLSQSKKYDWGMRAIKSVLVVAGGFKRADATLTEQAVLMRSLRDTNVAKIEGDDRVIFMGLLADLFPGISVPRARDYDFEKVLISVMEEDYGYTHFCDEQDPDGYLLLKITQLIELLAIRHCVFLMGNPGSFKSSLWKILKNAKTRSGEPTKYVDFSPKAISTNELYGFVNMQTREWKDGILSNTMRSLGAEPNTHPKWIMLDGDLDANWIESMNSVMDDNRLLTLPSNERITLKAHMKMIFEIRDLNYATPATATRAGIVCMDDTYGVQWRSYVVSWIKKLDPTVFDPDTGIKDKLQKLFDKYVPDALFWMLKNSKILGGVPLVDIALVSVACSFLQQLLKPECFEHAEHWFVFCFTYACGMCLTDVDSIEYRKNFSTWWKSKFSTIKYATKDTIFHYYVNEVKLEEWTSVVDTLDYSSQTPMGDVTVPTTETVAVTYFMKALIYQHHPTMCIGLAGCGKTQTSIGCLKSLDPEFYSFYQMNMSYYTDSTLLQAMMENPLEKKAGRLYGPPGKLQMIYFIDDLNMPALDKYNTQSAIELMKEKQDYDHWYDRSKITLKDISNTQYLSCMNPTAGSFIVNPRLQRHFWTVAVPFPENGALDTIYKTFMSGHFERLDFHANVKQNTNAVVKAALNLHDQVVRTFRKTAANFHYEFNIRHMSGVFGGLMQAKPTEFTDGGKLVLLWIHESERVYGDRLVSVQHLTQYREKAATLAKTVFDKYKNEFGKYFGDKNPEPLVFAPFSKGIAEMDGGGTYDKIAGETRLSELLGEALRDHNENQMAMDLVLFGAAMQHVSRICRIITNPSGHPLLVGVGGSGRQSLSRLSSWTCGFITMMIVISGGYGMNELKTDLQSMYSKAGLKDEGVMFLFTDSQITKEKFLVFINDLLASGDIADLYASDEKDAIKNGVRSGCKAAGILDSPDNLWNFFIGRIRKNLHMSLCFSPVGDDMRNRSKKFPALVNCTVIDWFQPWPEEALYNVGVSRLTPIEQLGPADSPGRAGICNFMPYSFSASGEEAEKFMKNERRFAYATPKSYLELINLYTSMVGSKVDELADKKERLQSGLTKLRKTESEVAILVEDIKEMDILVAAAAKEADEFVVQVAADKDIVDKETNKANTEAAKCAEIEVSVTKQAQQCQAELDAAEPLVIEAKKALDVLDKKDFQTLKAFTSPPPGIDTVLATAIHLLATLDTGIDVDKKGVPKDDSWKGGQKLCSSAQGLIDNLLKFPEWIESGQVPSGNVERARKIKDGMGETFSYDAMMKKSGAIANLCVFVINIIMYYDVVVTVEPKRQALAEATQKLNDAKTKKKEMDDMVADLTAKLKGLQKQLGEAIEKKESEMAKSEKCKTKLDYANRLVGALSANGVIWEQTIENSAAALEVLPGECLVACSFSSYVGVFTRQYRQKAVAAYIDFLKKNDVKLGDNPDPLEILSTDADRAKWAGQGLPADQVSMENGAIMTNSQRWPLIIDPQLQGIVWIRNKEADNNLQVTRMGQKTMVPTFEQAIDHGRSVLIENMGEKIDAVLAPVISRTTIKRGSRRVVKLGDKEIYLSPTFKMFMQTKLSNPHYPPEVQAECTIINFTVTEDGLEDQLLFLVVRLERPDLAKKKSELITQQNEFKVTLAELEKFLLEKLADAGDDILEDTVLICSLEDAKNTSDTVKEKTVIAQQTEAQINETSEYYRPVGNRGSLLFFLLMDLCKMHTFYRYSLDSFVMVVTRAVNSVTLRKPKPEPEPPKEGGEEEGEKEEGDEDEDEEEEAQDEVEEEEEIIELHGNELKQRVILLEKVVTYAVFDYTRRGLLDSDKLTVATMMTLKMLLRRQKITQEEVNILVNAPADLNPGVMPDNARSFLTDVQWAQLKTLEHIAAFKSSGALTQQVESEKDLWKRWVADEKPESVDLPRGVRELSLFHRLFLLRVLRPDRMGAALTQFIIDNCGQEYIEQDPFDMFKCYEESTSNTPFFFVLFPGTDPTPTVEAVAASVGCTVKNEKLMNISMGQGQEKKALLSMDKLATTGGWVMLQNIHLMQEWLPQLERALETIEEIAVPEFRCVLTSEPPGLMQGRLWPLLPEAILQRCIKVSDESPTDLKSNLRRAYSKFSQANIDACLKPKEFKATLFALCFFHALISGRIKFGPQGWSKKYPFNDGDLTICGEVLCNYLNNSENLGTEVPWADLRYLFGEIMYGGHITDFWDRKVDVTYLEVLVTPELLANVNLCPAYNQGFKSPDATKLEYAQYTKYIEDKFPPEQPQMYGLHPNAEIGFLTAQGAAIWTTIREIAGGSGGGGGGGLAAAQTFITGYMDQLPKNMDMLEIRSGLKEEDMTPYVMVSLQESERMNLLLSKMRSSMIELELGISGALNVTENMEELSTNLQVGRVNAGWAGLAYPSLKGLAAWFADLLLRVAQLVEWTTELKLLRSLWLSGFFNPMSFMTAVMQTTARTQSLPLDFMTNRCKFTNTRDVGELGGQPADGVYIHGLFMEGSGWEEGKGEDEGYITDSKMKDLHPYMPICNVFSVEIDVMDWTAMYHCPVFATSTRGATFIFQANVKMDPDDDEKRWVLAGAALLTQDD